MQQLFAVLLAVVLPGNFALNLGTTCPSIFQYGIDKINDLYGEIWVPDTENHILNLEVQMSIANSLSQNDVGRLELAFSEERIQSDLKAGKPIHYHLYFPAWENNPPRVKKIKVNNVELCKPGPGYEDSDFPIISTISVQHYYNSAGGDNTNQQEQNLQIDSSGNSETSNFGFQTEKPPPRSTKRPNNQYLSDTSATRRPVVQQNQNFNRPWTSKPINNQNRPQNNQNRPQNAPVRPQPAQKPQYPQYPSQYYPYLEVQKPAEAPLSEVCGITTIGNLLVVNGDPVPRNMFPWIVPIYHINNGRERFICGGSLISHRHVLTAAHCLKQQDGTTLDTSEVVLALGRHNITNRYEGITIGPKKYYIHPEYSKDADIAVIELALPVSFSEAVQPICLWDEETELDRIVGYKGLVVGWGKDESGSSSMIPKETVLPIVSQSTCYDSNQFFQTAITDRTFCAGTRMNNGPCNGDSGGGFMMLRNGRWVVRGIVSMSVLNPISTTGKCDLKEYVVFTDVSKYTDWIYSFLWT